MTFLHTWRATTGPLPTVFSQAGCSAGFRLCASTCCHWPARHSAHSSTPACARPLACSYQCYRHWLAPVLRVSLISGPGAWKITTLALQASGRGGRQGAASSVAGQVPASTGCPPPASTANWPSLGCRLPRSCPCQPARLVPPVVARLTPPPSTAHTALQEHTPWGGEQQGLGQGLGQVAVLLFASAVATNCTMALARSVQLPAHAATQVRLFAPGRRPGLRPAGRPPQACAGVRASCAACSGWG